MNTRTKIAFARLLYKVTSALRKGVGVHDTALVTRDGIKWNLDLREGIDLSIYLFGMFERSTVRAYRGLIQPGDVVFDIGANIGAHTLQFARLVGSRGRVIAFEPTAFAHQKLIENVGLNPNLMERITVEQIMLTDGKDAHLPTMVYSSWPLTTQEGVYTKHLGKLQETTGARMTTLDDYLQDKKIAKVDFIKLDVDGNEYNVLLGSQRTLAIHRPKIILELAPYALEEAGASLGKLVDILTPHGYQLTDLSGNQTLSLLTQSSCAHTFQKPGVLMLLQLAVHNYRLLV